MPPDAAEIRVLAEWLGEVHGEDRMVLSVPLREALMDGATRLSMWGRGDIPNAERPLSADAVALFKALIMEMAEPARSIAGDFRGAEGERFVRWMQEGTLQTPAKLALAVRPVVTPQCQADMAAQGAAEPEYIRWLDLTLLLGRHVGEGELEGGQHALPPQMMEGAKLARKLGAETLETVLVRAKAETDLAGIEGHFSRTLARWASSGHPFAARAAGLLMEWWLTAKRTNGDDARSVIEYITEYRAVYVGRGLPVMYDATIQATVTSNMIGRLAVSGAGGEGGRQAVPVEGAAMTEAVAAVTEKLNELRGTLRSQQRQMRSQQRQMDGLRDHMREGAQTGDGGGGGGAGGGGGRRGGWGGARRGLGARRADRRSGRGDSRCGGGC
jgi:hypothetical protein